MTRSPRSHPWARHLNIRKNIVVADKLEDNDQDPAPHKFNDQCLIRPPGESRAFTIRELVTLDDVIVFREETDRLRDIYPRTVHDSSLPTHLESLSLNEDKNFHVIYRFTDIIQYDSLAILEAIHFELFKPDRPDLRFIALPIELLTEDACEGDYYKVLSVICTPDLFMKHGEHGFWVQWTVNRFEIMKRGEPVLDYILVTEKIADGSKDRKAVCDWTTKYIRVRQRRFVQTSQEKRMKENEIYEATIVDSSSAWIYPVEPPKNREEYSKLVEDVRVWSHFAGTFARKITVLSKSEKERINDRLDNFDDFAKNMQMAEQFLNRLLRLGQRFRKLATPKQTESIFVINFDPPKLQVCTEMFYLDSVTLLFDDQPINLIVDHIKRESYGKRKKTFIYCQPSPEFLLVLGAREPDFCIEATLHGDGDSATERILDRIENESIAIEEGEQSGKFLIEEDIPNIIQAVYGNKDVKHSYSSSAEGRMDVYFNNGEKLELNSRQNQAMIMYHKIENAGYCILSPPGSGKTTVAAAMAASLVKDNEANRQGSVQMLLAVQNVAVENLALALKTFDEGNLKAYRMVSKVRTDPNDPLPYGIFEQFPNYRSWMGNAEKFDMQTMDFYMQVEEQWRITQSLSHLFPQQIEEAHATYMGAMFNAKAVLEKYLQPEIILSTVDLVLYRLMQGDIRGIRGQFEDVDRIIIDEASLLTESSFYCLMRCFPKASFVLIGDDKQLHPFMFDDKVLGHQLAGRAALTVAMRRNNVDIIKLVEVYRAPQQLVEPYNNLSYEGSLVSRKKELIRPLFDLRLVPRNKPDLLLVDIPKGHQKGCPSPYNEVEIEILVKLLNLFPKEFQDDIMLICLYKEQKTRLQRRLGPDYEIMTVDSSQGKEKPIVIVLTTRTDNASDFFSNYNRCTVAVSRHQRALIILGNHNLLSNQLPWSAVLQDFTRLQPEKIPKPIRNPWKVPQNSNNNYLNPIDFPLLDNSVPQQSHSHVAGNSQIAMPRSSPLYGNPSTSNLNVQILSPIPNVSIYNNRQRIVHTINNHPVGTCFPHQNSISNCCERPSPPQNNISNSHGRIPYPHPHPPFHHFNPPIPSPHHFNPHIPPPHHFYPQSMPYHNFFPKELYQNPLGPNFTWY